jgi:hypothetical protein
VFTNNSSSVPFSFSEYVLLSPSSINHDWMSCTVRAIIAPGLTVSLLLGGPFLHHNCLVIDHETRTCIPKNSNYDLLNPPITAQPTKVGLPSQRMVLKQGKTVINELKNMLTRRYDLLVSAYFSFGENMGMFPSLFSNQICHKPTAIFQCILYGN